MLQLSTLLASDDPRPATATLTLPFELRRRARLRARLDSGEEVALLLDRGLALREGDRLLSADGERVVRIRAKSEALSVVRATDLHLLTRAAYHLGNRHVPLQVEPGRLAYEHDHVLDGLVRELGLSVEREFSAFEPEAGGYGSGGGHAHGAHHGHHPPEAEHHDPEHGDRGHRHRHDHDHDHDHGPPHGHEHALRHDHESGHAQRHDHGRRR